MSVSVEKVSSFERRLTIVVPANKLEEAYQTQINRFAKQANIKGFRPGKAPLSFIQQRFGDDAHKQALNEVIQGALYDAISENKLNPISAPRIEPKSIILGQPLEFIALFEVLPEMDNIQFSMPSIEKLSVEVTQDDVQRTVQQLLKQYTKWTVVEREAQTKDRVVIDYYAIFDGQEELGNKVERFPLELGSKVMIPGFEDGLVGAKAGDERKLSLQFPADFHIAERAGKPVDFMVQIKQVFEAEEPVLNNEFIQKLGVKSGAEEDLLKQITQSLEQERNRLVREKLKEQVFRLLLEQNPLEVPQSLIAREAKNIHDEIYPSHRHHDHHDHSEAETTAFNDVAKKRVCLGLLIAEYAKQTQMKPDQNRVLTRIQEIASAYEKPEEVINWLSSEEQMKGIEAQVMEDQVMDKLTEGVPVTEKSMSYAELKGIQ
jgi:trigger factor